MKPRAAIQLAVLTLAHFTVDFYGGLLAPIWNPTLRNHLGGTVGSMLLLVSGFGLVVNAVQPIAGLLLPRRDLPWLLVAPPLLASAMAFVGFARSPAAAAAVVLASAVSIALFHPEGMMGSHAVSGRMESLGVPLFISGGFFGMSTGNLLAGWWADRQGLRGLWSLSALGVVTTLLMLAAGLHRLHGRVGTPPPSESKHGLPFAAVLLLGTLVALNATVFVQMLTSVMIERIPDHPQQWAGRSLFAFGICGAIGSYLWGTLSNRFTRSGMIAAGQGLAIPPLVLLIRSDRPESMLFWSACCGLGMGGAFPLVVILSRHATGLSQRLRAAVIMGGSWGLASVSFAGAGLLLSDRGASAMLVLCVPVLASATLAALAASRWEARLP